VTRRITFEAWEEIAISLPNLFWCERCHRLVGCFYAPDPPVCTECKSRQKNDVKEAE